MIALFLAAACAACAPPPPSEPLTAACSATDGDTLRCGDERIRLLGIDTPELPGHCRRGRVCVEGDGEAAKAALAAAIAGRALTIRRTGEDRYGRTLASVHAEGIELSCYMLENGAIYVRRWDARRLVWQACPELAE